jgi:hypothetical protein
MGNMNSPREQLETARTKLRGAPGNEVAQRAAQSEVSIDCAIEITEALIGLKVAVEDMANRTVTVANNLIAAIDKATVQLVIASGESTNVAKESATLSGKLNRLTKWIIAAAVLSAIAAAIQAGVALHAIFK